MSAKKNYLFLTLFICIFTLILASSITAVAIITGVVGEDEDDTSATENALPQETKTPLELKLEESSNLDDLEFFKFAQSNDLATSQKPAEMKKILEKYAKSGKRDSIESERLKMMIGYNLTLSLKDAPKIDKLCKEDIEYLEAFQKPAISNGIDYFPYVKHRAITYFTEYIESMKKKDNKNYEFSTYVEDAQVLLNKIPKDPTHSDILQFINQNIKELSFLQYYINAIWKNLKSLDSQSIKHFEYSIEMATIKLIVEALLKKPDPTEANKLFVKGTSYNLLELGFSAQSLNEFLGEEYFRPIEPPKPNGGLNIPVSITVNANK
jgi:hypothetical protein